MESVNLPTYKPPLNPKLIGARIFSRRTQKGWTQTQLATNAGISRATLQKIEVGHSVRPSVIQKIARCFEIFEWELIRPLDESDRPYRIDRGHNPTWLIAYNNAASSCLYPDGSPLPDISEKDRLGRLGFVSIFQNRLNVDLVAGRLHATLMEIYGDDEKGPFQHEEEEFIYCLRGEVQIRIGEDQISLTQGESMCFWPTVPHTYQLPRPLKNNEQPPLLLCVWTSSHKDIPLNERKVRRKPR